MIFPFFPLVAGTIGKFLSISNTAGRSVTSINLPAGAGADEVATGAVAGAAFDAGAAGATFDAVASRGVDAGAADAATAVGVFLNKLNEPNGIFNVCFIT